MILIICQQKKLKNLKKIKAIKGKNEKYRYCLLVGEHCLQNRHWSPQSNKKPRKIIPQPVYIELEIPTWNADLPSADRCCLITEIVKGKIQSFQCSNETNE